MKVGNKTRLIIGIIIAVVMFHILWQLGQFSVDWPGTTSKNFAILKPRTSEIRFANTGDFTGVFINEANTTIKIGNVRITDDGFWNISCAGHSSGDLINAGKTFTVVAKNCGSGEHGGIYNIEVTIEYESVENGVAVKRNESGLIRGPFE